MPENQTQPQNILYIVSCSREHPEMAVLAFVHAVGAQAMDIQANVVLLSNGVWLARRGFADGVSLPGMPPLTELLDDFFKMDGHIYVCTPCIQTRMMKESDLIDGAETTSAGRFAEMCVNADAVLNY